uniref:Uncharacterized protein n=1 Tax=viral metagenome TaxID=1070528 RepID=A0A6C0L7Y8_9ZZZZ
MTTLNLNNINDDLIEINRDTFSNKQMSFNIPSKQQRANQNNFMSEDVLFNKNKISNDVISMSSRSSSRSSSRASSVNGDYDKSAYMKNMNNIYKNKGNASGAGGGIKKMKSKYDEDSESSSVVSSSINKKSGSGGGGSSGGGSSNKYKKQSRYEDDDDEDEEDDDDGDDEDDEGEYEEDDGEEDEDGEEGDEGDEGEEGDYKRGGKTRHLTAKEIIMNELNEKREIIYQLDRLESKGFKIPFKFNMNSDLEEMRTEYNRLIREKELDGSVRFQQKMLMAFISGTEYMNSRYDPFAIKLDGWSEQVNENINDYDDIFEELHYKYKATGKKMAPELRLFISLSGSAFMFHLTSRMFKDQPLPNVENVLKSDPELMKQFQQAAAKQYMMGNTGGNYNQMPPPMSAMPQMASMPSSQNVPVNNYSNPMSSMGMGDSGGLFGMVSSLFSTLNTPQSSMSMPQMSSQSNNANIRQSPNITELRQKPAVDIENIINNVHNNISIDNNDNNIETLSVSDEEITSIIEDTADIKILRGVGRPRKNTRTLNI